MLERSTKRMGRVFVGVYSTYSSVISLSGNYAVCRAKMKKRQELSFLTSYLRQASHTGDADRPLFSRAHIIILAYSSLKTN